MGHDGTSPPCCWHTSVSLQVALPDSVIVVALAVQSMPRYSTPPVQGEPPSSVKDSVLLPVPSALNVQVSVCAVCPWLMIALHVPTSEWSALWQPTRSTPAIIDRSAAFDRVISSFSFQICRGVDPVH